MTAFHPDTLGTLDGLFRARAAATPEAPAYRQFDEGTQAWVQYSWAQIAAEVARWQRAFSHEGLVPGDRVAIMLKNSVEWIVFDQAALGMGLVTVPLYLDDRPDNAAYILEHAGAKLLLVEGRFQHRVLAEIAGQASQLQRIVSLTAPDQDLADWDPRFMLVRDWLERAADTPVPPRHTTPDQLASIVYTSGTTGRPKGVMLTHGGLLANAYAASRCAEFAADELFLSFLPLSHALERTGGYYLPMLIGAEVAYSRSVTQLAQDLVTLRPTVLISVPRIYERVYGRIQEGLTKKSPVARKLFELAVRVGWRRFQHAQGMASWHPELLLWPLLDRLVAGKVTEKLGGRLRFAISGGAALSTDIAKVFIGLGVPIIEGYGLTEAGPVVCVNRPESNVPGSIGLPLDGVEVKIGENDELLTRSVSVMRGYWRDEAATQSAIDTEGWLHTGDQVRMGARGHYFIVGRIKDIIVMSNGEKVPPVDIEAAIALDPLFEQVMVVGEGRAFLVAVTVLNAELWPAFAHEIGVDPEAADALTDTRTVKALTRRVAARMQAFPGYAQVRRVHAELTPWTIENGFLTPTMKLKRKPLTAHYREALDAMFAELERN